MSETTTMISVITDGDAADASETISDASDAGHDDDNDADDDDDAKGVTQVKSSEPAADDERSSEEVPEDVVEGVVQDDEAVDVQSARDASIVASADAQGRRPSFKKKIFFSRME